MVVVYYITKGGIASICDKGVIKTHHALTTRAAKGADMPYLTWERVLDDP